MSDTFEHNGKHEHDYETEHGDMLDDKMLYFDADDGDNYDDSEVLEDEVVDLSTQPRRKRRMTRVSSQKSPSRFQWYSPALQADLELMENLVMQASKSHSEEQAIAFIAACVPIASKIAPTSYLPLTHSLPLIIEAVVSCFRVLYRRPDLRIRLRQLPTRLHHLMLQLASFAHDDDYLDKETIQHTVKQTLLRKAPRRFNNESDW